MSSPAVTPLPTAFRPEAEGSATAVEVRRATGRGDRAALLGGVLAMAFVGGSVAVSGVLQDAPVATAQAVRYGIAGLMLLGYAGWARVPLTRPSGTDWWWLAGVVGTGLVLFNVALVRGSAHAEPAVLAVAVACVPLVLALAGPLTGGRAPDARLLLAAGVVTVGAAVVQGWGRSDLLGLGWALVVLVCEACFTLLAVPLLRRHHPVAVSIHTTVVAAIVFGAGGLLIDGPGGVAALESEHWGATICLAVVVTALAFVLWYGCVSRVGAGRAGLLSGVAPVAAAALGALLTGVAPSPAVWLGTAVVGVGLALGLRGRRLAG